MKESYLKIALTCLLFTCINRVCAHDFEVNGIYFNVISESDKTVEVTYKGSSYSEYSNEYTGHLVLPSSIDIDGTTYSVTSVGDKAFYQCSRIVSVDIPSSIKSIENKAFYYCFGITSIKIPNSVISIGEYAFEKCSGLENITIGNSVQIINKGAFRECSSLKKVTIPNSVKSIGDYAFGECDMLASVSIGNSVESIGAQAFFNCLQLASIIIPNNVTSIGEGAFDGCTNLRKVTIGSRVTKISDRMFSGCENLKDVIIPNSVTSIGEYAFQYCSSIINIEIPNSVESIEEDAFYVCTSLESITIGSGVSYIGYNAFSGCRSLASVHINDLSAWCNIDFSRYSDYANPLVFAKNLYLNGVLMINLVIPNDITKIKYSTFRGCTSIKSVRVPSNVTAIDEMAFYKCENLKTVINNSNLNFRKGYNDYGYIAYYADRVIYGEELTEDYIFSTEGNQCYLIEYLGQDRELVLPENHNGKNYIIKENVFTNNSEIASVTITNGAIGIQANAFRNCASLKKIIISDGATSLDLDNKAFENSPIEELYIGRDLTYKADYSSGYSPFYNNKTLKKVVVGSSVSTIGNYLFDYCKELVSIEFSNNINYIGNCAFENCVKLQDFTLPSNLKTLGELAFIDCTSLKNLVIPRSVNEIGVGAFSGCGSLKSIIVQEGNNVYDSRNNCNAIIETMTNFLLSGCENTIIPNSTDSIANWAFRRCGMAKIDIPDNVKLIKKWAFYDCDNLSEVKVGDGVVCIEQYAFCDCGNLENIRLGSNVNNIGNNVFTLCKGLKSIYLHSMNPPLIGSSNFETQQFADVLLYVPMGSIETYKSSNTWSRFKNLQEFDTTGMEDILLVAEPMFEKLDNGISLTNAIGKSVAVYTVNGLLVNDIPFYTGEVLMLDNGIYVIRIDNHIIKVIL